MAGMHRSGTSALTRVLGLLGLDLPNTLLPAREDNPLGYWEPAGLVEAHDEFLEAVGSSYDDVLSLDDSCLRSAKAAALEDRLVEILEREFGGSRLFVVKDPRICRLVPPWRGALERVGADPAFILQIRNPLEVAASLKERNDFALGKGLLLWLRHVLEAERHTRDVPRVVVSYEALLRDWRSETERIAAEFTLAWPRSSHAAAAEIEDFLSPRRRHHVFDPEDVEGRADIADWVERTYGALAGAASGAALATDVLDAVTFELDRADLAFGPLVADGRLALATEQRVAGDALARKDEELATERSVAGDALARKDEQLAASGRDVERLTADLEARDAAATALREELASSRAQLERLSDRAVTAEGEQERLRALADEQARELAELRNRWRWLPGGRSRRAEVSGEAASRTPEPSAQRAPTPLRRGARARWRSVKQFASWIVRRPRSGGLGYARTYLALRRSSSFDAAYYLARYPDVGEAGVDPLMHYVEHGAREGREPAPGVGSTFERRERLVRDSAPSRLERPVPPPTSQAGAASRPDAASGGSAARPASRRESLPAGGASRPEPARGPSSRPAGATTGYSDFVILLARQRSGTNPVRSVLATHPEVFCFNEVFNLVDKDSEHPLLRESNFFTFMERYAGGDVRRLFPDNHERLFLDFLEYLRCIAEKEKIVVDVKYNTTHLLTKPWSEGPPYFFELLKRHGLHVLNLTRKNYLRYVLSAQKAWNWDRYTVLAGETDYTDAPVDLGPGFVLARLEECSAEDAALEGAFASYPRYFAWDYADVFPGDEPVSEPFLADVAARLGIANDFRPESVFKKQASLPLAEAIENFDTIETVLRGTRFAYCLEDEPAIQAAQRPAKGRASDARPRARRGPTPDWPSVIGMHPDEFCDGVSASRPGWITGSLSHEDARFLFGRALAAETDLALEIGTASGFSTAILCHATNFVHRAGLVGPDWQVVTCDVRPHLYYDESKRVGDAARAMLPADLLEHVSFRAPATALDVRDAYGRDALTFMFVDADHLHPWPSFDLLATLDCLRPGAEVVLHDINLPLVHAEFAGWGVKHLFDDLEVAKRTPDSELPNTGSIIIPDDRDGLREQLVTIIFEHAWQVGVPDDVAALAERDRRIVGAPIR